MVAFAETNDFSFNPRSCTRSDQAKQSKDFAIFVSIHAPVQGATKSMVFIKLFISFNPRSCTRSDRATIPGRTNETVSIHAPVQGATFLKFHVVTVKGVSIHAPVQGATKRRGE